jgi:hypothetical protein
MVSSLEGRCTQWMQMLARRDGACPLRVKRVGLTAYRRLPLHPANGHRQSGLFRSEKRQKRVKPRVVWQIRLCCGCYWSIG